MNSETTSRENENTFCFNVSGQIKDIRKRYTCRGNFIETGLEIVHGEHGSISLLTVPLDLPIELVGRDAQVTEFGQRCAGGLFWRKFYAVHVGGYTFGKRNGPTHFARGYSFRKYFAPTNRVEHEGRMKRRKKNE